MPKIQQKIEPLSSVVVKAWSAPSSTEFGTRHLVLAMADSEGEVSFTCSCKGFQYNSNCWHVDQASEDDTETP